VYSLLNDLKVKHKCYYITDKIIKIFIFIVDFSSKDIKQDLCRLLVKGKDEDNDKFEMKVGVMRMFDVLPIVLNKFFFSS
jgi:hypothetical protein